MADDLLEAYVRRMIEAQQGPEVTIAWQGGEPTLMGLDFFRRAMGYVQKHARPGMTVEHTLQTNGTMLDEGWCAFFREHNFLIGLSLDGPRAKAEGAQQRAAFARAGRNDPCPCGSGKKFKFCHGRTERVPSPSGTARQ